MSPVAKTNRPVEHDLRQTKAFGNAIYARLNEECDNGVYHDALQIAAESLHKAGVEPASLFDDATGDLTDDGFETLHAAVGDAWQHATELAHENYGTTDPIRCILQERQALEFLLAEAAEREEKTRANAARVALRPAAATATLS